MGRSPEIEGTDLSGVFPVLGNSVAIQRVQIPSLCMPNYTDLESEDIPIRN